MAPNATPPARPDSDEVMEEAPAPAPQPETREEVTHESPQQTENSSTALHAGSMNQQTEAEVQLAATTPLPLSSESDNDEEPARDDPTAVTARSAVQRPDTDSQHAQSSNGEDDVRTAGDGSCNSSANNAAPSIASQTQPTRDIARPTDSESTLNSTQSQLLESADQPTKRLSESSASSASQSKRKREDGDSDDESGIKRKRQMRIFEQTNTTENYNPVSQFLNDLRLEAQGVDSRIQVTESQTSHTSEGPHPSENRATPAEPGFQPPTDDTQNADAKTVGHEANQATQDSESRVHGNYNLPGLDTPSALTEIGNPAAPVSNEFVEYSYFDDTRDVVSDLSTSPDSEESEDEDVPYPKLGRYTVRPPSSPQFASSAVSEPNWLSWEGEEASGDEQERMEIDRAIKLSLQDIAKPPKVGQEESQAVKEKEKHVESELEQAVRLSLQELKKPLDPTPEAGTAVHQEAVARAQMPPPALPSRHPRFNEQSPSPNPPKSSGNYYSQLTERRNKYPRPYSPPSPFPIPTSVLGSSQPSAPVRSSSRSRHPSSQPSRRRPDLNQLQQQQQRRNVAVRGEGSLVGVREEDQEVLDELQTEGEAKAEEEDEEEAQQGLSAVEKARLKRKTKGAKKAAESWKQLGEQSRQGIRSGLLGPSRARASSPELGEQPEAGSPEPLPSSWAAMVPTDRADEEAMLRLVEAESLEEEVKRQKRIEAEKAKQDEPEPEPEQHDGSDWVDSDDALDTEGLSDDSLVLAPSAPAAAAAAAAAALQAAVEGVAARDWAVGPAAPPLRSGIEVATADDYSDDESDFVQRPRQHTPAQAQLEQHRRRLPVSPPPPPPPPPTPPPPRQQQRRSSTERGTQDEAAAANETDKDDNDNDNYNDNDNDKTNTIGGEGEGEGEDRQEPRRRRRSESPNFDHVAHYKAQKARLGIECPQQ